jgi:hypothetical protein
MTAQDEYRRGREDGRRDILAIIRKEVGALDEDRYWQGWDAGSKHERELAQAWANHRQGINRIPYEQIDRRVIGRSVIRRAPDGKALAPIDFRQPMVIKTLHFTEGSVSLFIQNEGRYEIYPGGWIEVEK